MNIQTVLVSICLLCIWACKPSNETKKAPATTTVQTQAKAPEQTTKKTPPPITIKQSENKSMQKNVSDGPGEYPVAVYRGILPCIDCEGIKTKFSVMEDGSLIRTQIRIGDESNVSQSTGTWEEVSENKVLITYLNPEVHPDYYQILPNKDLQQMRSLERHFADNIKARYVLTKVR